MLGSSSLLLGPARMVDWDWDLNDFVLMELEGQQSQVSLGLMLLELGVLVDFSI